MKKDIQKAVQKETWMVDYPAARSDDEMVDAQAAAKVAKRVVLWGCFLADWKVAV